MHASDLFQRRCQCHWGLPSPGQVAAQNIPFLRRATSHSLTMATLSSTHLSSIVSAICVKSILHTTLLAISVSCIVLALQRLYLHPLSPIPGPKLAALTSWYEFYYDVLQPGQYVFKIQELHKHYGTASPISHFPPQPTRAKTNLIPSLQPQGPSSASPPPRSTSRISPSYTTSTPPPPPPTNGTKTAPRSASWTSASRRAAPRTTICTASAARPSTRSSAGPPSPRSSPSSKPRSRACSPTSTPRRRRRSR